MFIPRPFSHLLLLSFFLFASVAVTKADENLLDKGIAEYKAENYEEALEIFLEAKKEGKDSSRVSYYLGLAYKQTGNLKEAVVNLRDAASLTPPVNDAYAELIEVLYNMNELKEAGEWIAKAEKENVRPAHVAYLKGLVLAKEGRTDEAIASFKKAKELDRSLAQSADLQTAVLLAEGKKYSEARESLKAVIAVDPSSDIASFAREYDQAVTRAMESYKTWRLRAGIAYQYDDNVILKPTNISADQVTGESDSSVVAAFRVDYYTPLKNGPWFFKGQYYLYSNTYFRTFTHDLFVQSVSLVPGRSLKNGAVTLPVYFDYLWLNERGFVSALAFKPTYTRVVKPGHICQITAGVLKRDFLQAPVNEDEDRDGNVYSLAAGYIHPFSGGRGVFNARYEFSKDEADGRNWDNKGNRINMGVLVPFKTGVKIDFSGEIFLQDYENTHTVATKTRKDRTYYTAAMLIWELTKKINLNIQYSYTRGDSNIAAFDYERNVYTGGLEYNF